MAFPEFRKRVLPIINNAPMDIPTQIKVSDNTKTGMSINLSIVETCHPTKACMKYCYGLRGPSDFRNSILSQHANTTRFNYLAQASEGEVVAEAANIIKAASRQGWIRWNGVGDLIPGSVRVINKIAELDPNLIQWVVSRKPEMVENLKDQKSIKILFSLDETTTLTIIERARKLKKAFKHAKFRFSYVRRSDKRAPRLAHIVFNEHIGRHKGAWSDDKRTCEATLPQGNHKNSCDTCRRCFS